MTIEHVEKQKQREEYLAFMALKDEAEALAFVKARIISPVGKLYYTPTDYRWFTMSLKARLVEAHDRRWSSIWGLLNRLSKTEDDEKFHEKETLVVKAMVSKMTNLGDWVESRYAVPKFSYLLPGQFSTFKNEAEEDWDLEDTLDYVKAGKLDGRYENIRYYWKKVEPSQEDSADGRRHCILLDMETHEEAPLLPGVQPYAN